MPKPTLKQKSPVARKPQIKSQNPPVTAGGSTQQDKLCFAIFAGIIALGVILTTTALCFILPNLAVSFKVTPINWLNAVGMSVLAVLSVLFLRFAIWASFVSSAMFAGRSQSFQAQEKICRWAMKYKMILPGGASWAVQALLQQMLTKGQYKEVIAFGSQEYELAAKKNPKDQSLSSLSACIGMAYQVQGESHGSILWNERAVEGFSKIIESMQKAGPLGKLADKSIIDGMRMQFAGAFANLGASYFNVGNYGKAKKNFGLALEEVNKVPDSSEKQNLVRVVKEHMARLKHW